MDENRINRAIEQLQAVMDEEGVDPVKGLPQELFLFATTLMPCANIDLFVSDGQRLLLTWRDDEFYGRCWHIPGGCLRLLETLDTRIQKTAIKELGTEVVYDREHFITRETMERSFRPGLKNQYERCHNISMLFNCSLPSGLIISNHVEEKSEGYMKWFDHIPEDMLGAHRKLYGDIIDKFFKGELQWTM